MIFQDKPETPLEERLHELYHKINGDYPYEMTGADQELVMDAHHELFRLRQFYENCCTDATVAIVTATETTPLPHALPPDVQNAVTERNQLRKDMRELRAVNKQMRDALTELLQGNMERLAN